MQPCGLVMDWMRSAYDVRMVFETDGDPFSVKWFKAIGGAKTFPGFHAFPSSNWNSRQVDDGDLGEQPGTFVWRDGSVPSNAGPADATAVQCATIRATQWTDGLQAGPPFGPYDADGVPLCCVTACNCLSSDFDNLVASISDVSNCSNLVQTVPLSRTDPALCTWSGTYAIPGGTGDLVVQWIDGNTFSIATTCSADVGALAVGTLCPAINVEWTLFDDNGFGCCADPGSPRSFKVTVTS